MLRKTNDAARSREYLHITNDSGQVLAKLRKKNKKWWNSVGHASVIDSSLDESALAMKIFPKNEQS